MLKTKYFKLVESVLDFLMCFKLVESVLDFLMCFKLVESVLDFMMCRFLDKNRFAWSSEVPIKGRKDIYEHAN